MKASRPLAFVVLAFVVGATISQASFAFADDSSANPFRAIWDAISELQTKTDSLQSQIDDLRELRGATAAEPAAAAARISEPSVTLEVSTGQPGQTVIQVIARNAGPENAVGVKLSTYYQMSLFSVNFIEGAECFDQARGIIECYLGTLDTGSEARISINATPLSLGQQAVITTDISSITEDANQANNHFETMFITAETPVVIPPVVMPPVAQSQEQIPAEPAQPPQEQAPAESEQPAEQQAAQEEQPSEEAQPPQESQQEQAPAESEQPAEQQSEPPAEEVPAEPAQPPQEQAPAESEQPAEQQSSPPPAEQSSSPGGEAPSSGGESSGGESPPPPPSGGEGSTG